MASIDLVIGNSLAALEQAQAGVQQFLDQQALDAETAFHVLFALEEVVSNIILHGDPGRGRLIQVRLERHAQRLQLEVQDDGITFNPLSHPAPDTGLPLADRPIGGLGIFLTRQLADSVAYQRRADRNVLTIGFSLPREGGGAA